MHAATLRCYLHASTGAAGALLGIKIHPFPCLCIYQVLPSRTTTPLTSSTCVSPAAPKCQALQKTKDPRAIQKNLEPKHHTIMIAPSCQAFGRGRESRGVTECDKPAPLPRDQLSHANLYALLRAPLLELVMCGSRSGYVGVDPWTSRSGGTILGTAGMPRVWTR